MAVPIAAALALVLFAGLGAAFGRTLRRARRAEGELDRLRSAERSAALRDPLTGLLNDAALGEHLIHAAAHARRRVEPLSVVILDVRALGDSNERFGRQGGDQKLRAVADCMRSTLRAEDVYGRLSGGRFLVILAGTIGVQAELVAERLAGLAARTELTLGLPRGVEVDTATATAVRATPEGLLQAAETELHRVKAVRRSRRGRALSA